MQALFHHGTGGRDRSIVGFGGLQAVVKLMSCDMKSFIIVAMLEVRVIKWNCSHSCDIETSLNDESFVGSKGVRGVSFQKVERDDEGMIATGKI